MNVFTEMSINNIEQFVKKYFIQLDSSETIGNMEDYFYKEKFHFIKNNMEIDSLEEYVHWKNKRFNIFNKIEHIMSL